MELKKQVKCITTGEIFGHARLAGERYNIKNYKDINKCCNGKIKSAGKDENGKPLVWEYVDIETELKDNSFSQNGEHGGQEGGNKGETVKKLKASDFNLNFSGRQGKKNKAFLMKYASLDYMTPEEIDKLADRMSHRLSATEKSMRKEWHDKHLDASQIDEIMQGR